MPETGEPAVITPIYAALTSSDGQRPIIRCDRYPVKTSNCTCANSLSQRSEVVKFPLFPNLDSTSPTVLGYASDPFTRGAPMLGTPAPASAVPEPSELGLLGIASSDLCDVRLYSTLENSKAITARSADACRSREFAVLPAHNQPSRAGKRTIRAVGQPHFRGGQRVTRYSWSGRDCHRHDG